MCEVARRSGKRRKKSEALKDYKGDRTSVVCG